MIQVQVALDKEWAAGYLREHGRERVLDGMLIMAATEGGEPVGCGVMSMEADSARIHELCCDDGAGYLMGKALLNLIDNAGLITAYCDSTVPGALAAQLGFKPCDTGYELSLDGYFSSHCG